MAVRRAFFRVFAFHILLFQGLAIAAWDGDVKIVSTVVLTHAGLCLLSSAAAAYMTLIACALHIEPAYLSLECNPPYSQLSVKWTGECICAFHLLACLKIQTLQRLSTP